MMKNLNRRQMLQGLGFSALALISLLVTWKFFKPKQIPNLNLLDFADWRDTEDGDFAVISHLDLLENLEALESEKPHE